MLFTSFNFLVFFCITFIIYNLLKQKHRWILILVSSLIFYALAVPVYIIVLTGSILLNYLFGRWIDRKEGRARKQILIFGIILNLLLLAGFRYAGAFWTLIHVSHIDAVSGDHVLTKIIVPLGISFFTFTNISYLIEIKRRKLVAERHLGYFACYISFFPKLIQGPIERPQHFLFQLREDYKFDYGNTVSGIRLMLWGFFKKLVIADQLSLIVNTIYDDKLNWHGPLLALATILFAFQIYMDFSGYIDIARGAARILGFNLTRNFYNPYLSVSIKDFWSRWHISLSQWLRDYIFLPLAFFLSGKMKKRAYAGIRTEKYLYLIAITVTFLLCGLWHGVGWNFIVWGGIFAIYLVTGNLTEKTKKRLYRKTGFLAWKRTNTTFQVIITFLLVSFAWIFFRAPDFHTAFIIVPDLFSFWGYQSLRVCLHTFNDILLQQGIAIEEFLVIAGLIPFVLCIEYYFIERTSLKCYNNLTPLRWGTYFLLVLLICYFGRSEINTFIYFQF
jgi:alginate O-acetyltransferase complex protein AlgI